MRRSRSALTAWPAFADLMTVLAVLGLAIAAGVASVDGARPRPHPKSLAEDETGGGCGNATAGDA